MPVLRGKAAEGDALMVTCVHAVRMGCEGLKGAHEGMEKYGYSEDEYLLFAHAHPWRCGAKRLSDCPLKKNLMISSRCID
jgi:hypothetical protein